MYNHIIMSINNSQGNKMSHRIAILMTTYNAGIYLEQQLKSIEEQSYNNWILCVSDDGSSDNTSHIISLLKNKLGKERVLTFMGPGKGFAQNFLSLVNNPDIQADYYAYCDQDDIWDKDKLHAAVQYLSQVSKDTPAVYGSRTMLVDADNKFIGYSSKFTKKPSLSNAFVQSLAGGNTMVFNNCTRQILMKAGVVPVVSHDWWTYLAVAACNGVMIYDEISHLRYRQHSQNLVGSNSGISKKIKRIRQLFDGEFYKWVSLNLSALTYLEDCISQNEHKKIEKFKEVRDGNIFVRLLAIYTTGVYRQTFLGNIGIFIGFLFRKI